MSDAAPWTIGRLLQWTTEYLPSHGSESPRLDAEVLLAHALSRPRIALYTAFDEVPPDDARGVFRDLVRRRAEGVPVAYLVGYREFYSLRFEVTSDVLIPRPETEHLVVALLDLARTHSEVPPLEICDVGTGSGIIAVCAAKHLPGARVLATDRSAAALAVARANARSHGVADRIAFAEGDLLNGVAAGPRFDFIVSNPPYVATAEFDRLARDVREHEPRKALLAGDRGTEVIERLVPQAAERLKPGGHLLIEISPMIHDAVCGILRAVPGLRLGNTIKDLARLPRVVHACKADN
ncbi:MAG: peptide chain release factor N(5)-glutamine methyltransferase [Thermoguttaceae bacterium]|jgi:release factor glutamine methyltransferase|nr:peptide chain release factor N(5)-glutamine methyltransferase [Thermoguttaceae bacterium]